MSLKKSQRTFLALALLLSSCSTPSPKAPKLTTCILDSPAGALECFDPEKNQRYPLDLSFSNNYVCFPPDQAQELIEYLKLETP